MHLVGFFAAERVAIGVLHGPRILRTFADHLHLHRRRHAGGEVIIEDVAVHVHHAGRGLKLVAAEERQAPGAVRIVIGILAANFESDGAGRDGADVRGVGQNGFHARIRIERFALRDADGSEEAERGLIAAGAGFFLDDVVEHFPERIVAGRNVVGRHAGAVDKFHRGRIRGIGEVVNLEMLLHRFHAGLGGAVHDEGAEHKPVAVGAGLHHEITFGDFTFVAGREDEIFAAFAVVFAGDADIGHPAIPEIIEQAQDHRRHFHDERALVRVGPDEVVDSVVVRRQFYGAGVHEIFPDDIRLVIRPVLADRIAHARLVHDRDGHEIRLQRARAVQIIVNFFHGVGGRIAVVEVQGAEGTFNFVRHGHARRDGRGIFVLGGARCVFGAAGAVGGTAGQRQRDRQERTQ